MNYSKTMFNTIFGLKNSREISLDCPQRVGVYIRMPKHQGTEKGVLEKQMQWYAEQLKAHPHWTFVNYYIDESTTEIPAMERPEFIRMIEDAKQGEIDLIVTRDPSRFTRNAKEFIECVQALEAIGTKIYFIGKGI